MVTDQLRKAGTGVRPSSTGVCQGVYDAGTDQTTFTDTRPLAIGATAVSSPAIVVGASAQAVGVGVATVDDCFGADRIAVWLENTTTHAQKYVELSYYDSDATATDYIDYWVAATSFSNYDRGTWAIAQVGWTDTSGSVTFDASDNVVSDDRVVADAQFSSGFAGTRVAVSVVTATTADGSPEPVKKGNRLTVKAATLKAQGSKWVANGYQRARIEYRAPGSGKWKLLAYVNTNRYGQGSTSFKVGAKGTWSFRTVYYGGSGFAKSISKVDYVTAK